MRPLRFKFSDLPSALTKTIAFTHGLYAKSSASRKASMAAETNKEKTIKEVRMCTYIDILKLDLTLHVPCVHYAYVKILNKIVFRYPVI